MKRIIKFIFPRMPGQGRREWIIMNVTVLGVLVLISFPLSDIPLWIAAPVGFTVGAVWAVSWRVLVRPRVDSYYAWKQNAVPLNEDHPDWGKK